jgi:orotate phosphoribosyltransferase-like protein
VKTAEEINSWLETALELLQRAYHDAKRTTEIRKREWDPTPKDIELQWRSLKGLREWIHGEGDNGNEKKERTL